MDLPVKQPCAGPPERLQGFGLGSHSAYSHIMFAPQTVNLASQVSRGFGGPLSERAAWAVHLKSSALPKRMQTPQF